MLASAAGGGPKSSSMAEMKKASWGWGQAACIAWRHSYQYLIARNTEKIPSPIYQEKANHFGAGFRSDGIPGKPGLSSAFVRAK